jgi:hypothetical protein
MKTPNMINIRSIPSFPTRLRTKTFGPAPSKPSLTISLLLALAAWATTSLQAENVLFNGNLDATSISSQNGPTPDGWIVDATKTISGGFFDGCSSEPWCNVVDSGGFGVFFKPFQGNQAEGDLLSVQFYQDNPATPGTKFTLAGYAAGEANYSGFFSTNAPAPKTLFVIQFLNAANAIIASNGFDLVAAGLPSGGPGSMSSFLYTTPQVTAPAATAGVRAGVMMLNVYSTTGAQSFFVDGFDLESVAPPGSPVITNQPAQVTVSPGATATFTVGVSNTAGVSYQWQLYNTNLANGGKISGATSATLTVSNVSAAEVGHYRVLVSNASGSVYSGTATLALMGISFNPVISLTGKIGDTYRVDYATALATNTWIPLSTNKLTTSPQLLIDSTASGNNTRFYRAVFLF